MLQIEVAVVGSRRTFFGKESISKDKNLRSNIEKFTCGLFWNFSMPNVIL